MQVTPGVQQENYFSEDLRWPSRSQRFGWLVTIGIMIYIGFELNLQITAPMIAFPAMLIMIIMLLVILTLQQHLAVRIGPDSGASAIPTPGIFRRFRRNNATQPEEEWFGERRPLPVLRISYTIKTPISALAPGRRGARLARREHRIPLTDVERWYAARIPRMARFRRSSSISPVGFERDAVTIELKDGQKLTLSTELQPVFLRAMGLARVDAERQTRVPIREEL